ncbi:MAG: D-alanyl-D-alanine carboxypeptidase family protein [Ruminococcaceae bacterium]|nr:D-alanyl-D-alanine carboxypeptidase family protein [Oscillospiraceae bacterium]
MNFSLKTDSRELNIAYIVVVSLIFVLTLVTFSSMFVFNSELAPDDLPDDKNEQNEINYSAETAAKIHEYKQTIKLYDEMLSAPYLKLVNKQNPLEEGFVAEDLVQTITNPAVKLNSEAAAALQKFIEAAAQEGIVCTIVSGYRTYEDQESYYTETYQSNMNAGYSKETAENMTNLVVAKAGESEAETGLTVEIATRRGMTVEEMEASDLYKFAKENMYKYGFILRYPQGKESITEYNYSPFLFRYVGSTGDVNHAQYIYEKNLTLEEYTYYLANKKAEAKQSLDVLEEQASGK